MTKTIKPEEDVIIFTEYKQESKTRRIAHRTFHPDLSLPDRVRYAIDCDCPKSQSLVMVQNNCNLQLEPHDYGTAILLGRNYMMGQDTPLKYFLSSHTSYISKFHWMQYAIEYAIANPEKLLSVEILGPRKFSYEFYCRGGGNYVEMGLPHHGAGGEKHWIIHPNSPRKRVLVNVD